jgi:glycosyltransferase involved in cell wall biosynthesis
MFNPLVSVIIPLFNKEDFIEATIKSVIEQSYENLELILVDDSSSDTSFIRASELVYSHKHRFARVQIETRKNTGQAAARNDGIRKSKGEFVAFLDADDIWHPHKIARQVNFLINNPEFDLVFCNYFMFSSSVKYFKAVNLAPIEKKVKSWLLTTGYGGLLESTGLVRRSALLNQGGFDPALQMCGGLDLAYRFSSVKKAGCVKNYLCGYRVTPGGWHNNKSDLVYSYSKLFEKRSLYGDFESIGKVNLRIHLDLWFLKSKKNRFHLQRFLITLSKNPLVVAQYLTMTLTRVTISQIKGFWYWRQAQFITERIK